MGTPQTTELMARALLADRERSIVEAGRLSWDHTPAGHGSGLVVVLRFAVGHRIVRLGVRVSGVNVETVEGRVLSLAFPS